MFFIRKRFVILSSFFVLTIFCILVFGNSFVINFSQASSIHPDDSVCYSLGGVCAWRESESDHGPCTVNGKPGYIHPGVCRQYPSLKYRCCRPIDESKNTSCTSQPGADCVFLPHTNPSGSCTVNGKPGTIKPGLCTGAVSNHYRCCVPDEVEGQEPTCGSLAEHYPADVDSWPSGSFCSVGTAQPASPSFPSKGGAVSWDCIIDGEKVECEATRAEEDSVYGDQACDYIEGQCHWVSGSRPAGDLGECTVNGEDGCYVYGACRAEAHEMRDNQLYLCCTSDRNLCEQGVDYTLWEDLYVNEEGCPFSDPSESNDQVSCWQGPDTPPSHHRDYTKPSIDVGLTRGTIGTEYFIAPEDGEIIRAKAFTTSGATGKDGTPQRCGCDLRFKGDSGIIYEIRHCLLFTGVSTHFHPNGRPKGDPIRIKKGTVLTKIALETDDNIIEFLPFVEGCRERGDCTCATGPHFHVRVTEGESGNIDRCVDCHFVDDYGCNLVNPKGIEECGRCDRSRFPTDCWTGGRVADWGGVKCDDTCAGCNIDDNQYCCESDKVWCCVGPPTAQICDWVCKCPHPPPTGPGWGIGGSGGGENSVSDAPEWIF